MYGKNLSLFSTYLANNNTMNEATRRRWPGTEAWTGRRPGLDAVHERLALIEDLGQLGGGGLGPPGHHVGLGCSVLILLGQAVQELEAKVKSASDVDRRAPQLAHGPGGVGGGHPGLSRSARARFGGGFRALGLGLDVLQLQLDIVELRGGGVDRSTEQRSWLFRESNLSAASTSCLVGRANESEAERRAKESADEDRRQKADLRVAEYPCSVSALA